MIKQLKFETDLRERLLIYIGHDLRQPINAIDMLLYALPNSDQNILEAKECVRSSKRLISDIVQLADFNKKLDADHKLFDIQSIFDSIKLEYSFSSKQANCELKVINTKLKVFNDSRYIQRILNNFVSNAITHSKATKILIGVRRRKNSIDLLVIDNGCGIYASDKHNIFKEFAKGTSSNQSNGLGLGLVIAKHYADVCDVEILFESITNKGSKFGMRFHKTNTSQLLHTND